MDRTSRTQFAADEIARRIFVGAFRPGQQLTEQGLARQLSVSRIPVREALRELASEGLVHLIPRRGAFVNRMDPADVAETYEARALLEGYAVRLCAEHIGPKGVLQLQDILGQMRDAVSKGEVDRYSDLNMQFQAVIWENTPNRVLAELARQLSRRSLKLRLIAMRLPGRAEESLASHEHLFEAIRNRDPRSAEMIRWLTVQRAKRALLSGYFGEGVRPEHRSALERDLPSVGGRVMRLVPAASGGR